DSVWLPTGETATNRLTGLGEELNEIAADRTTCAGNENLLFVHLLCCFARDSMSTGNFCHPGLHNFSYDRRGQKLLRREPNSTSTDLEISQIGTKLFQRRGAARIKRAMLRPCSKEN